MAVSNGTENPNHHIHHITPWPPLPSTRFMPRPPPCFAQTAPWPPFGGYSRFHGPAPPRSQGYNMAHSSSMRYSQRRPLFQPLPGPPCEPLSQPSDPQLHNKIVTQIDYYFSVDNLVKDTYLRQNMDEYGWVSIRLIAGFNKVKQLTDDMPMILSAVRTSSSMVEVSGDKVRRRCDWKRWILPANLVIPGGRFTQSERE